MTPQPKKPIKPITAATPKAAVSISKPETKPKVEKDKPNIFQELASHLSGIGGKLSKEGDIVRQSALVHVAGGAGGPVIKLPGVISTRCETLDAAIGIGGVPLSRLTVITGGEGGGKTTLCGHLCAEIQAMDGIPIYIDNEHKIDLDYMACLGVDLKRFLITQPSTIEDSLSLMNETINMVTTKWPGKPILAVLDSINASKSEHEYEEDGSADFTKSNQAGLGSQARVMSDKLPKLMRAISGKPVALVFISQPRDNIGTPGRNLVAGGSAPKFYMAVGIELYRKGFWEESGKKIGSQMIAKVFKNQVSKPMKEAELSIRWGVGIDYDKSLTDQLKAAGVANVGASGWAEMVGPNGQILKWQGARGVHKLRVENPEIIQWMREQARGYLTPKVS